MSCGEVFPSDLVPIKDVNDKKVQVGRFAVEVYNRIPGHHFVYNRIPGL